MNIIVQRRAGRFRNKNARAKGLAARGVLVSAAVMGVGCDNRMDDGPCGSQLVGSVKVAVWWGQGNESESSSAAGPAVGSDGEPLTPGMKPDNTPDSAEAAALSSLLENFKDCSDVEAKPDDATDKAASLRRLEALPSAPDAETLNALPDVFQVNAGQTAFQYAPCGGSGSRILAPLPEDLWPADAWTSPAWGLQLSKTSHGNDLEAGAVWLLPKSTPLRDIYRDKARWVRDYISCEVEGERQYWVAPLAIHHLNRLFFNRTALGSFVPEALDSEKPIAFDDLSEWLTQLEEWSRQADQNPDKDAPVLFALPNDPTAAWAVNLLASENVKVALNLSQGNPPKSDAGPVNREVLNVMERLRAVSQLGKRDEVWSVEAAMEAVLQGRAVFTVMGDWAYPDVASRGVMMTHFPGTRYARVYTIDGFAAVNKNPSPEPLGAKPQARAWMQTVASPGVARDFAVAKGALVIDDWLAEVMQCAIEADADGDGRDCWVMPALAMSAPQCDGANQLLDWVREPWSEEARLNAGEQLEGRCERLIHPAPLRSGANADAQPEGAK